MRASINDVKIISIKEQDFLDKFGDLKAKHFVFMGIPELPIYFDPHTRTAYIVSLDVIEVK